MAATTSKYQTLKVLGEGGYGKAVLVKARDSDATCVMKEVRLTALKPNDREEALREAQVLSARNCPNIIKYVESFQERGCFYIIMEYADGGDLSKKIEARGKTRFPESEVLHDFIQIALALKYIHDRKILHRDLKTENVFLMKDGTIKLGDFGIAKVLDHTFELCRTQIGTPYYLSPEICDGKSYNSKTDIWSLGCLLYELCTLRHPFDAANMNTLLTVILRGKYQPISQSYSKDIRALLSKMLMKDPSKRPSVNQILGLPFIKKRLSAFLDESVLADEMSHTVLHGQNPLSDRKPATPVPTAPAAPVPATHARREQTPVPLRADAGAERDDGRFLRAVGERNALGPRDVVPGRRRRAADGAEVVEARASAEAAPDARPPRLLDPGRILQLQEAARKGSDVRSPRLLDPERIQQLREQARRAPAAPQTEFVRSVRDALRLPIVADGFDAEPGFGPQDQRREFFIGQRKVCFPPSDGPHGREIRAGAMRDFLVKEIGLDVLVRINDEIRNHEADSSGPCPECLAADPGIVLIARYLSVLESEGQTG
jgi:NIMA (never in mitosis gene a)-related kinase